MTGGDNNKWKEALIQYFTATPVCLKVCIIICVQSTTVVILYEWCDIRCKVVVCFVVVGHGEGQGGAQGMERPREGAQGMGSTIGEQRPWGGPREEHRA